MKSAGINTSLVLNHYSKNKSLEYLKKPHYPLKWPEIDKKVDEANKIKSFRRIGPRIKEKKKRLIIELKPRYIKSLLTIYMFPFPWSQLLEIVIKKFFLISKKERWPLMALPRTKPFARINLTFSVGDPQTIANELKQKIFSSFSYLTLI